MKFPLVVIRGAGDLATGVGWRLFRCGFPVVMLELPRPLVIRRTVAFANAIFEGSWTVEGVRSVHVSGRPQSTLDFVPVLADASGRTLPGLAPEIVVDARMEKRPGDTTLQDAPLVIGLGPGFEVGVHCHRVVETQRGHFLGKVYESGTAIADSGIPGMLGGETSLRILRSPRKGVFETSLDVGAAVEPGTTVGTVGGQPIVAALKGTLRGLLRGGTSVSTGLKVGDVDPRPPAEVDLFTISDKSRAVGGGVLEAIMSSWKAAVPR